MNNKNQITKMSDNGTLLRDANDPRFILMVDISESKKNPGDYFYYASGGSHGKVMFTLSLEDFETLMLNQLKSMPHKSRAKVIRSLYPAVSGL